MQLSCDCHVIVIDTADGVAKDLIDAGLVEGRELVVGKWRKKNFF